MAITSVTRTQIEEAAKQLERSVAEMRRIAAFMKDNNLDVLACHWLTMHNTYIPQIRRFLHGMDAKARDQVLSRESGVQSSAEKEIAKTQKDPRTRAGKAFMEQVRMAVEAELKRREEGGQAASPSKTPKNKR